MFAIKRSSAWRNSILASFVAVVAASHSAHAANEITPSQGGPGEVIQGNDGNMFMEEVVDLDKWNEEEARRKKPSNLERPRLTEKQLIDNGFQMTPSGNLVPLINRGAPPIQQQGTTFTQTYEPMYGGVVIQQPSGPSFNPYLPSVYTEPQFMNPFMMGPWGGFGPWGYGGMGYGGFGGMGYGGFGRGGFGFGRGGFGLNFGGFGTGFMNPLYGYGGYGGFGGGMYGTGYSQPTIISAPSYSYTWQSKPGEQTTAPGTITSSGSVLQRPFWNGFAGRNMLGDFQAAGSVSLPMINQWDSSTTFTPIPPSGPFNP